MDARLVLSSRLAALACVAALAGCAGGDLGRGAFSSGGLWLIEQGTAVASDPQRGAGSAASRDESAVRKGARQSAP